MGQAAEEKASNLAAMLYPEGMASFLFPACHALSVIHPAKRNFFLCALCAFVAKLFNL
jgi:hypothetical protein